MHTARANQPASAAAAAATAASVMAPPASALPPSPPPTDDDTSAANDGARVANGMGAGAAFATPPTAFDSL